MHIVSILIVVSLKASYNSIVIDSKNIEMKQVCQRFKALGDPTRLQILALLADEKRCVCDLQTNINVPANLLSHHLKVLRDTGLVEATKRGRWIDYSLNRPTVASLKEYLPPSLEQAGIEQLLVCGSIGVGA